MKGKMFSTQKLSALDNNLMYQQFLADVMDDEKEKLAGDLQMYLSYVANRLKISCNYYYGQPVNGANASVNTAKKEICLDEKFQNINTAEEFVFCLGEIEHEFAHLVAENNKFSVDTNKNGVKNEGWSQLLNISANKPYITNERDKNLLRKCAQAMYILDEDEVLARKAGVNAQCEFLTDLQSLAQDTNAKKYKKIIKFCKDKIPVIKENERKEILKQQTFLKEHKVAIDKAFGKAINGAVKNGDEQALMANAVLQDNKYLFSPENFEKIKKGAVKHKFVDVKLQLDNSIYGDISTEEFGNDAKEFLDKNKNLPIQETLTNLANILYNRSARDIRGILVNNSKTLATKRLEDEKQKEIAKAKNSNAKKVSKESEIDFVN